MPTRDRERSREYQKAQRERNRLWLRTYLATNPCVDCGETDPIVLEFDHQRDKAFKISNVAAKSPALNTLIAEVAKCKVRCANCHRKKTYRERGHTHRD